MAKVTIRELEVSGTVEEVVAVLAALGLNANTIDPAHLQEGPDGAVVLVRGDLDLEADVGVQDSVRGPWAGPTLERVLELIGDDLHQRIFTAIHEAGPQGVIMRELMGEFGLHPRRGGGHTSKLRALAKKQGWQLEDIIGREFGEEYGQRTWTRVWSNLPRR